jgi:hypothetical protein
MLISFVESVQSIPSFFAVRKKKAYSTWYMYVHGDFRTEWKSASPVFSNDLETGLPAREFRKEQYSAETSYLVLKVKSWKGSSRTCTRSLKINHSISVLRTSCICPYISLLEIPSERNKKRLSVYYWRGVGVGVSWWIILKWIRKKLNAKVWNTLILLGLWSSGVLLWILQ